MNLPGRLSGRVTPYFFGALTLTLMLPGDGHSQTEIAPKWAECFAPHECEVRVFASPLRGRKGRLRLLAARAASACQAAGYAHYVAGAVVQDGHHYSQRVYFTHDTAAPARPCSFSATAELEAEAMEMARAKGYPWPVRQASTQTGRWTFELGENDWGEKVPFLDEIASPIAPALRSDQGDLRGILFLGRDCATALAVGQLDSEPGEDWWAYSDGGLDLDDRILEVRVDGRSIKEEGQNVTKPTAGMVASSKQTFGLAVRSAEHEDNAAFEWAVADQDRTLIREHFPHCVESSAQPKP